jgi:hypothetical protein
MGGAAHLGSPGAWRCISRCSAIGSPARECRSERTRITMSDHVSVLIVEDEGFAVQSLKRRLVKVGYRIAGVCARGEEALVLAEAYAPGSGPSGYPPRGGCGWHRGRGADPAALADPCGVPERPCGARHSRAGARLVAQWLSRQALRAPRAARHDTDGARASPRRYRVSRERGTSPVCARSRGPRALGVRGRAVPWRRAARAALRRGFRGPELGLEYILTAHPPG